MFQIDYFFMNRRGDPDLLSLLGVRECQVGATACTICDKGPSNYSAEMIVNFIKFCGRKRCILRHDNEHAIAAGYSSVQFAPR